MSEGRCTPDHFLSWPGSAGPLRGRKRDIWEGGHRVPTMVSYPAAVKSNMVSWTTVNTVDFLPTMLDVLGQQRPAAQRDWTLDGTSILPLLKTGSMADRGIGWIYRDGHNDDVGFRYGKWKYVDKSKSCGAADCRKPMLFDLSQDLGEYHNVAAQFPDIFRQIQANATAWVASLKHSMEVESGC